MNLNKDNILNTGNGNIGTSVHEFSSSSSGYTTSTATNTTKEASCTHIGRGYYKEYIDPCEKERLGRNPDDGNVIHSDYDKGNMANYDYANGNLANYDYANGNLVNYDYSKKNAEDSSLKQSFDICMGGSVCGNAETHSSRSSNSFGACVGYDPLINSHTFPGEKFSLKVYIQGGEDFMPFETGLELSAAEEQADLILEQGFKHMFKGTLDFNFYPSNRILKVQIISLQYPQQSFNNGRKIIAIGDAIIMSIYLDNGQTLCSALSDMSHIDEKIQDIIKNGYKDKTDCHKIECYPANRILKIGVSTLM